MTDHKDDAVGSASDPVPENTSSVAGASGADGSSTEGDQEGWVSSFDELERREREAAARVEERLSGRVSPDLSDDDARFAYGVFKRVVQALAPRTDGNDLMELVADLVEGIAHGQTYVVSEQGMVALQGARPRDFDSIVSKANEALESDVTVRVAKEQARLPGRNYEVVWDAPDSLRPTALRVTQRDGSTYQYAVVGEDEPPIVEVDGEPVPPERVDSALRTMDVGDHLAAFDRMATSVRSVHLNAHHGVQPSFTGSHQEQHRKLHAEQVYEDASKIDPWPEGAAQAASGVAEAAVTVRHDPQHRDDGMGPDAEEHHHLVALDVHLAWFEGADRTQALDHCMNRHGFSADFQTKPSDEQVIDHRLAHYEGTRLRSVPSDRPEHRRRQQEPPRPDVSDTEEARRDAVKQIGEMAQALEFKDRVIRELEERVSKRNYYMRQKEKDIKALKMERGSMGSRITILEREAHVRESELRTWRHRAQVQQSAIDSYETELKPLNLLYDAVHAFLVAELPGIRMSPQEIHRRRDMLIKAHDDVVDARQWADSQKVRDLIERPKAGKPRYFLALDIGDPKWEEVTEDAFVEAERNAGFFPKGGQGVATGGFGGHGVRGKVVYGDEDPNDE